MNDEQLLRYSRHILLPQMDVEGQQRLLDAHVVIIGLGGLGSPVLQYLAASGVGTLSLVDDDQVELSNLQRQVMYGEADCGRPKVSAAAAAAMRLNSTVRIHQYPLRADEDWLEQHLPGVSLVVDCSDNAGVRYALNTVCLRHGIPWLSAAAVGVSGQITFFAPQTDNSPCYRCLYPQLSPQQTLNCAESGVLSPLVGVIGAMQALEAVKVLAGNGSNLNGRLLTFDAMAAEWRSWNLPVNPDCPDCAGRKCG